MFLLVLFSLLLDGVLRWRHNRGIHFWPVRILNHRSARVTLLRWKEGPSHLWCINWFVSVFHYSSFAYAFLTSWAAESPLFVFSLSALGDWTSLLLLVLFLLAGLMAQNLHHAVPLHQKLAPTAAPCGRTLLDPPSLRLRRTPRVPSIDYLFLTSWSTGLRTSPLHPALWICWCSPSLVRPG